MFRGLIFMLFIGLSGCMSKFHQQPYLTYADEAHSLSDTAVFSTAGFVGNTLGQIIAVNGKETSCWEVGCPIWVRVLPGDNVFTLRFSVYDNGISSYKQGQAELKVSGMKAKHLYEVVFSNDSNGFSITPKDLGENPTYSVVLGLKGFNQKAFPVRFE
ncbi:hypothetical protein K5D32_11540 [Pseudomonas cichorii]|uniref:hypothetical protein n=1 Tax=Pseudomonas cichorii TaxID=36746 RepID=UPI001C8A0CB4|nr:hypothetical protein [Pseudomonas cichorii]MBX8530301.1 hypothetical protein [Pseudomonas cichorii]